MKPLIENWGLRHCLFLALTASQFIIGSAAHSSASIMVGDIVISELMPNTSDAELDWVELYNQTSSTIDLKGCSLTDDADDLIPFTQSLLVKPKQYIVIAGGTSNDADAPAALKAPALQFSTKQFQLNATADQVVLNCHKAQIDRVSYDAYLPGPASGSRGWQLEPGSVDSIANDQLENWCYTGLPVLTTQYLYGQNKVASPGLENPSCGLKVLPHAYVNNQQAVLIDGIDFEQTLRVAKEELKSDLATAELTIWALRDQKITPEVAKVIAQLYRDNIDKIYDSKRFTVIDWNHAVWHFGWAVANMYRNGDAAVKAELHEVYEDAKTRPQSLQRFQLVATDHILGQDILMGDIHDMGRKFARARIVVPGNDEYVQSYEEYLENRRSDFQISMINIMFDVKRFFSGLFS